MVHVIYDPSSESYAAYFSRQKGGGMSYFVGMPFQRGHGMVHFGGLRQRGAGLGAVLRSLWRFVVPLASAAGHALAPYAAEIGREGLSTGARILQNVSEGADLKETLRNESREGLRNAVRRMQTGSGRTKAKNRPVIAIRSKKTYRGRRVPKSALLGF